MSSQKENCISDSHRAEISENLTQSLMLQVTKLQSKLNPQLHGVPSVNWGALSGKEQDLEHCCEDMAVLVKLGTLNSYPFCIFFASGSSPFPHPKAEPSFAQRNHNSPSWGSCLARCCWCSLRPTAHPQDDMSLLLDLRPDSNPSRPSKVRRTVWPVRRYATLERTAWYFQFIQTEIWKIHVGTDIKGEGRMVAGHKSRSSQTDWYGPMKQRFWIQCFSFRG